MNNNLSSTLLVNPLSTGPEIKNNKKRNDQSSKIDDDKNDKKPKIEKKHEVKNITDDIKEQVDEALKLVYYPKILQQNIIILKEK